MMRWMLAAGLAWLTVCGMRTQGQATGLPTEVVRETAARLPAGAYTLAGRWTSAELSHQVGRTTPDGEAAGGRAWGAEVDADPSAAPSAEMHAGPMAYGPYVQLPAGDYVAFFRLKQTGETGDEAIATLDACTGHATTVLTSRDLGPADLKPGRYVQVPLAFRMSGDQLECRVHWQATTSLRLDTLTIFRREGPAVETGVPMAAQPVGSGRPAGLTYRAPRPPFAGQFPRSARPAATLALCDLRGRPTDVQYLAVSVQGLANRTTPRVYCHINAEDPGWLDWMKQSGRTAGVETVSDAFALLARFRGAVRGMVITDPALPASRNVATMIAGVMDGVIVSPRLAPRVKLPVLMDLRGRWRRSVDAYKWAYDTLWSRMNHHVAACLYPPDTGLRDYLIQHRVPVFWLPGRIDGAKPYAAPVEEIRLCEQMLARMPANVPIMGYPWAGVDIGMGEGPGVGLLAEFGKYLVGSPGCSNLSIHSGYPSPRLRQPSPRPPAIQRDRVYLSFLISDGDNLPVIQIANWPQLWRDKARGSFPAAWTISPSAMALMPDIVDFYYRTATPNDTLIAAVSGVGYTYPQQYGKRFTNPTQVFDGFLEQTMTTMAAMDLRTINPSGVGAPEIARYAERLPGVRAIFADYGRSVGTYEEATVVTSRNVPVFHGVTGWEPQGTREAQIANMVAQIKGITPAGKPAFLHVFVCNWFFDLPALQEVLNRLGPAYVAVSPDHLAALCRGEMERKQLFVQMPKTVGGIEGRAVDLRVPIRNLSTRPLTLQLAASGGGVRVAQPRVTLAPAATTDVALRGPARGSRLELTITGPFGRRTSAATMLLTPATEILGSAPAASARYAATFEAEGLPHITGDEADDATASGGRVRTATAGTTKPGHITYGPYRAYPAGRYVALFRIKRTGEGQGALCTLDATVAGAPRAEAERTVPVADAAVGMWRSVALPFRHAGGSLELRAVWAGAASMSIDRIELYALPAERSHPRG